MEYEFYKCIEKQYFEEGKTISTQYDNYGIFSNFSFSAIQAPAEYIYKNCLSSNFPIGFYWQLLTCAKLNYYTPALQKALEYLYFSHNFEEEFMVKDLVSSCSKIELKINGNSLMKAFKDALTMEEFPSSFINDASLLWEYIADKVRETINPDLPKRLKSYFLFTNKEDAIEYIETVPYKQNMIITGARIKRQDKLDFFDMGIWNELHKDDLFENVLDQYKRYWDSNNTDRKQTEALFQGELELFSL